MLKGINTHPKDLESVKKALVKTNKVLAGYEETPDITKLIKENEKQIKMLDDKYLNIKPHYEH